MVDMKLELKVAYKYVKLKQSAKDRGLDFEITLSDLKRVLKAKRCYYTGKSISTWYKSDNDSKLTIDRIDNDKGYVTGNIVACSKKFNQRKGNLTIEEIRILWNKVI